MSELIALPFHVFLPDEISLATSPFVAAGKLLGSRQVTDAHLLGIALSHRARLATLDRGILEIVPPAFESSHPVWLLTAVKGN